MQKLALVLGAWAGAWFLLFEPAVSGAEVFLASIIACAMWLLPKR